MYFVYAWYAQCTVAYIFSNGPPLIKPASREATVPCSKLSLPKIISYSGEASLLIAHKVQWSFAEGVTL